MKNFFHLTVSIILGSLLGYTMYYKIIKKGLTVEADTIAVDELFFADNAAFEKKQMETFTLSRTSHPDTLQVNVQLFETTQPNKTTVSTYKSAQTKPIRIIEVMQPIEVAQLQKNKTISIPVSEIAAPVEVSTVHSLPAVAVQEVSASAAITHTDTGSQEQPDKKKFLFFSKKSRNN